MRKTTNRRTVTPSTHAGRPYPAGQSRPTFHATPGHDPPTPGATRGPIDARENFAREDPPWYSTDLGIRRTQNTLEGGQDAGGSLGHTPLTQRGAQAHVHLAHVGQSAEQFETLVGRFGHKRAPVLPKDTEARRGRGEVQRILSGDSQRFGLDQTWQTNERHSRLFFGPAA